MLEFNDPNSLQPTGPSEDSASPTASGRLSGCGVVVAESDEAQRRLIGRFLESEGARVTCFSDGAEAVVHLFGTDARDEDTDIVLLNANLPDVCDIEAVRRLRDGGFNRTVIAMTWRNDACDRSKFISAGYSDLITKPICRDELVNQLQVYYRRKGSPDLTNPS